MKISELVKQLRAFKSQFGDVDVMVASLDGPQEMPDPCHLEYVSQVNAILVFPAKPENTSMAVWWTDLLDVQLHLEALVSRFVGTVAAKALPPLVEKREFDAVVEILHDAWARAPDKAWIHSLSGWSNLCDLLAGVPDARRDL